jgi:Mce-associated membrane protein
VSDEDSEDVTDAEVAEVRDADSTAEELDGASEADALDDDALDDDALDDDALEDDEAADATVADEEPPTPPDAAPRRTRFKVALVPLALVVALLASAGLATWLYIAQFRPDQQSNAAVAAQTVKAASDGAVALLSYAPESMDKDFATAKTHLTGDFLNYYSQFTKDIVTPAVKQKSVKTSATIVQAAASEVKPDSAVVLLFLNQTTTSKENPNGSFTASSVKVGLTRVDGAWLISAFDPV